jgi:hypothetical protein
LLEILNLFDKIVEDKIIYFHGTKAANLPFILKNGINSYKKSLEEGINVQSGERWSRLNDIRSFVSFTDVLDVAGYYSKIGKKFNSELSFPVIFCTTDENLMSNFVLTIHSDVPEIGVKDNYPLEDINYIMVPSNKVEIVKKMVGDTIPVLPIDDIDDRFYFTDDYNLIIIKEKYKRLLEEQNNNEENINGVKESVLSRTMSKISDIKNRFIDLFKGENEYERVSSR